MQAKLVILVLCLIAVVASQNKPCILTATDATTKKTWTIDLSKASKTDGYSLTPRDPSIEGGDWNYMVNFCAPVKATTCKDPKDYKSYQVSSKDDTCFYLAALAATDDSKMTLVDDKNIATGGVVLQYTSGETYIDEGSGVQITRQTKLTMSCDANAKDTTLKFTGEQKGESSSIYTFSGTSPYACAFEGSSGGGNNYPLGQLGVGGLLIILAVVGLILYFVIGLLVCKFGMKKQGVEIIPNVYFWKEIPFVLKDGVMLIVDCVLSLTKRGKYKELPDPK